MKIRIFKEDVNLIKLYPQLTTIFAFKIYVEKALEFFYIT